MKSNKQVIIDAIISHLEHGTPVSKICSAIASKFHLTERTVYKKLKIAEEQHKAKQAAIKAKLAEIEQSEAIEARKREIMNVHDRKALLTKIATGQIEIPKSEIRWDTDKKKFVTVPMKELPSHSTRIAAISELNKMEGDYAPIKTAETDSEGNDIKKEPTVLKWGNKSITLK